MPQTSRRFETNVTPESALPLKERLTAWRAHHLGEGLPDIPKPAAGRLGDITKPLLQILYLVHPERVPIFLGLVRDIEHHRLIDKSDSLEAQILLVVASLKDKVERGILPVKTITDAFNDAKPESAHLTYQRLGRKLWSLGFDKGKTGEGASAIVWDEEKFMKIFSSYGLGKTSETSETSETPVKSRPEPSDVSDVILKSSEPKDPMEPDIFDVSDVSDVYSTTCGEKNSSIFSAENIKQVVI
jgi:hypothetical protein